MRNKGLLEDLEGGGLFLVIDLEGIRGTGGAGGLVRNTHMTIAHFSLHFTIHSPQRIEREGFF